MGSTECDEGKSLSCVPLALVKLHPNASILFVRVKECHDTHVDAGDVQQELHHVHAVVDALTSCCKTVWKFNCGGGSFMLTTGVTDGQQKGDSAEADTHILESLASSLQSRLHHRHELRMTIHAGPVSSGIIGTKSLQYGLFGPTVDIASSISSMCEPGCLAVTNAVWQRLCDRDGFACLNTNNQFGSHVKVYTKRLAAITAPRASTTLRKRWNLCYECSQLESSFTSYFAARSVKMDITLLIIVIMSQMSWIHRWEFHGSYLYTAMVALVSFNFACLALVLNGRSAYLCWREHVIMASHLVHKATQVLVTVTPVYGTVYNQSYNSMVAILESSGFAGIMMLSFGLRMRFARQMAVAFVILVLSMLVIAPVCNAVFTQSMWCTASMVVFQTLACYVLPCAMVYVLERSNRLTFEATLKSK